MPGGGKLRFFKDKLEGYKKFHSIVKTMKMVTLAKYRQTLPRIQYRDATLAFSGTTMGHATEDLPHEGKILLVPITTNRGSCGALNSNSIRYVTNVAGDVEILPVGKKGNDSLSRLAPDKYHRGVLNTMKCAQNMFFATYLVEHIKSYEWSQMRVIFSRYISAGSQQLTHYTFPEYATWKTKTAANPNQLSLAIMEMDEDDRKAYYDFTMALAVLNGCCENELSEYAARIVAVENQLTNITNLWQEAEYMYNKTRKEGITAELLEIISAMTAMQGNASMGDVPKPEFWKQDASH